MKMSRTLFLWSLFSLIGTFESLAQDVQLLPVQIFDAKLKEWPVHILLDVRTEDEFRQGHLPGAKSLNYYSDDFKAQLAKLDKDKPVLVYCAVGGRSRATTGMLASLGFKKVYDLEGGIRAWSASHKPIVK